MKHLKPPAYVAQAQALVADHRTGSTAQDLAKPITEFHDRIDDRTARHRGASIRLGRLQSQKPQKPPVPARQRPRIVSPAQNQSTDIDGSAFGGDNALNLQTQEDDVARVGATMRSAGTRDSSSNQQDSQGGESGRDGARQALSQKASQQRTHQAPSGAHHELPTVRLFSAARDADVGSKRQHLMAEIANQYLRYANHPPGGGLWAVRQQLVAMPPLSPARGKASGFESSLSCLMPLVLLNLQRKRPPLLLALAQAKAAVMSGFRDSQPVATPRTSTWRLSK